MGGACAGGGVPEGVDVKGGARGVALSALPAGSLPRLARFRDLPDRPVQSIFPSVALAPAAWISFTKERCGR